MKVDILAIGVHPDDIELGCSGTLFRHLDMGRTVGLLDLTRGEMGTRGSAELRQQEAEKAAALFGAQFRINLGMPDCFFTWSQDNLLAIARAIRSCHPEIVLANALEDRHPDHGRAARLTADACFYAGLRKISTTGDDGQPQAPWRPKALYHYIQDRNLRPDFAIDITDQMERKIAVVKAFRSQFFLPSENDNTDEPQTPISGPDFLDFLYAKARAYGRPLGVDYAEGFNVSRTPGVSDLFHLL